MTYKLGCKSIQHHPTVDTTTVNPIVSLVTNQQKHWESTKMLHFRHGPKPKILVQGLFGGIATPDKIPKSYGNLKKMRKTASNYRLGNNFRHLFGDWNRVSRRGIPVRYSIPYTSVFPVQFCLCKRTLFISTSSGNGQLRLRITQQVQRGDPTGVYFTLRHPGFRPGVQTLGFKMMFMKTC